MIYNITQEAEEDLIRIYLYGYERFGESQATKIITRLLIILSALQITHINFHLQTISDSVIDIVFVVLTLSISK